MTFLSQTNLVIDVAFSSLEKLIVLKGLDIQVKIINFFYIQVLNWALVVVALEIRYDLYSATFAISAWYQGLLVGNSSYAWLKASFHWRLVIIDNHVRIRQVHTAFTCGAPTFEVTHMVSHFSSLVLQIETLLTHNRAA